MPTILLCTGSTQGGIDIIPSLKRPPAPEDSAIMHFTNRPVRLPEATRPTHALPRMRSPTERAEMIVRAEVGPSGTKWCQHQPV